jgi:hypothetical protein
MIEFRCIGCLRLVEGHPYKNYLSCAVYPSIEARWRMSDCPMAWHLDRAKRDAAKVRVGQQKQQKRRK